MVRLWAALRRHALGWSAKDVGPKDVGRRVGYSTEFCRVAGRHAVPGSPHRNSFHGAVKQLAHLLWSARASGKVSNRHGMAKPHSVDSLQAIRGVPLPGGFCESQGMPRPQRPSDMKVLAGQRLEAARVALGVTRQDVMADRLGVQSSAYSNWETGYRLADVAAMVRLLSLTGIGPDWIYAGETRGLPFDLAGKLVEAFERVRDRENPAVGRSRGTGSAGARRSRSIAAQAA